MSTEDLIQPDPAAEGQRRREAFLAKGRQLADAMTSASMERFQPEHNVVTAGQAGIFGPGATGQAMAANVAARPVRVGQDWGDGRELQAAGGTFDHNLGPAPARRDLRHVDMPPGHQVGESPLAKYMRERQ